MYTNYYLWNNFKYYIILVLYIKNVCRYKQGTTSITTYTYYHVSEHLCAQKKTMQHLCLRITILFTNGFNFKSYKLCCQIIEEKHFNLTIYA